MSFVEKILPFPIPACTLFFTVSQKRNRSFRAAVSLRKWIPGSPLPDRRCVDGRKSITTFRPQGQGPGSGARIRDEDKGVFMRIIMEAPFFCVSSPVLFVKMTGKFAVVPDD